MTPARSLLASLAALASLSAVAACPFCDVVGRSLVQRRDAAVVVAVGEAGGEAREDEGIVSQPLVVRGVISGMGIAVADTVIARVAGPVEGPAVVFGDATGRFEAVAADESLLGYVATAPPAEAPAAGRLAWFARRLEHPDTAIAEARSSGDAAKADACTRALEQALLIPGTDLRAGYDGLLGGLFVARGEAALDWLGEHGLLAADTRAGDARHTLAALRFAWQYLATTVPRAKIAEAAARLVANPAVAADAVVDLARWQHWESVDCVTALWDRLGSNDPLIRRAVAGYLTACPLEPAGREAARLQAAEPERWAAAVGAAGLPPRAAAESR